MKLVCRNGHVLNAGAYWCQTCARAYTAEDLSPIHDPSEYIDRWEIVERLSILPMAVLYRAKYRNQRVILKVALRGFEENLKREAKMLAQIEPHPALPKLITRVGNQTNPYWKVAQESIVQYYALYADRKQPLLRDKLTRQPQPPTQVAGWIVLGLAYSVLTLHEQGRALNLLNPDAITLHEERSGVPRPVLYDWMASSRFGAQPLLNDRVTRLLPPEFLQGGVSHAQSDVYSLGALLYELLAGRPLFGAQTLPLNELKEAILHRTPTPLNQIRPDLKPEIAGLVSRALNKNLEMRPLSVEAFAAELTKHFGELPAVKQPMAIAARWLAIGLVIAIALCSIALVVAFTGN